MPRQNKEVNVGLWEKQQHLLSLMEENELRKRRFGPSGNEDAHHRAQANEALRRPKASAEVMVVQGNARRQMPGSQRHAQSRGVWSGAPGMC